MLVTDKPNARLMPKIFNHAAFVVMVALSGIGSQIASAQTNSDDYKGKTITMMIGYEPGSAYDSYARLLVHHLGRHIPGSFNLAQEHAGGRQHDTGQSPV